MDREARPKPSVRRLVILATVLLGTAIRTVHLASIRIDLPHNGGGLFVEFAHQIAANGFRLPRRIPFYTDGGIPFAYPPLPFYLEAVFTDLLAYPDFIVANLLPPAVAVVTLIAFYWLTKELSFGFWTQATALLAYATMESAFADQTEASGLAEAFGSLALVVIAAGLARAWRRETLRSYALVGVLWAFAVVASPGSAYASVLTLAIFVAARLVQLDWRPRLRDVTHLFAAGGLALLLSSPYWLTVSSNHGFQIFFSSLNAQHGITSGPWEDLIEFKYASDAILWNSLLFCGMGWAALTGWWPLALWTLALRAIPREGWWMASAPGALLAGLGATKVVGPRILRAARRTGHRIGGVALLVALVALVAFPTWEGLENKMGSGDSYPEAVEAMAWAKANTPTDAKFVVLVNENILEWAPRAMQRTVLNEIFGTEFTPDKQAKVTQFKDAVAECSDFACIQATFLAADVATPEPGESLSEIRLYALISRPHLAKLARASDPEETGFGLLWQNARLAVGFIMPSDLRPHVTLEPGLGLTSLGELPDISRQGSVIHLDMNWMSRGVPDVEQEVYLSLVDQEGVRRETTGLRPFRNFSKHALFTGVVSVDHHKLQIDPHLPPGEYNLVVATSKHDPGSPLASVRVEPLPRSFDPPADISQTVDARFGKNIELLGYSIEQAPDSLHVDLHWRARRRPEGYYKVFVHLFDPVAGEVVAQHDAAPRDWSYPTDWWETGEVVTEEISLSLSDVPSGQYRLGVGLYAPETGQRLPVTASQQGDATGDRLVVTDVTIR